MILIKLTLLQNLQTFKQTFTLNQRAVINNFYLLHWNKGTAYTIQALRLNCLCSWKSWRNREILARSLENTDSTKTFKLSILDFVRLGENSVFAVHDINGLKLLTRLRLNFSHLNEHKFRHNFNDTINPMCSCGKEPETTLHYLLRCDFYSIYRLELLNDICALNHSLKNILKEHTLWSIRIFFQDYFRILKCSNKICQKNRSL